MFIPHNVSCVTCPNNSARGQELTQPGHFLVSGYELTNPGHLLVEVYLAAGQVHLQGDQGRGVQQALLPGAEDLGVAAHVVPVSKVGVAHHLPDHAPHTDNSLLAVVGLQALQALQQASRHSSRPPSSHLHLKHCSPSFSADLSSRPL